MFNQLPRSDLRAVHVAVLVDRESLRCTGRLEIEDIGDEIQHFAVGIPADPNAALPSRMAMPLGRLNCFHSFMNRPS